ncbi:MAG: 3-oxoacyl-[acyl-carrier-protein] reductase [Acidobacteria bacterium]|nr:3-oxoacyl-[acyl-carrier-protein] reductase [Acidobacteriota bacterium]
MPYDDSMIVRNALVTGASRGIGKACAFSLAKAGTRVLVAARTLEKCQEVAEEIQASGGEAAAVTIDLSSKDSIATAAAEAAKVFGPIHILVNNAGITKDGLALRMKSEDWQTVLDTNLSGAFFASQCVMQGMMKERWGRIINITSVVGRMGNAGQANYVAAKAGLIGLTKSLARELASRNITVNAVAPGFIATDMTAVLNDDLKQKMLTNIPLARFGEANDIAAAVRFLASEDASYITGHVLDVNGGMYM